MKIILWSDTKNLGLAQYVNQFLVWHKKFRPAQNVLGPVKVQGISTFQAKTKTSNFIMSLVNRANEIGCM